MGDDLAVVSLDFKRTDTMEQSPTRRPELDLLDESEEGYLLSIIDFFGGLLCHSSYPDAGCKDERTEPRTTPLPLRSRFEAMGLSLQPQGPQGRSSNLMLRNSFALRRL